MDAEKRTSVDSLDVLSEAWKLFFKCVWNFIFSPTLFSVRLIVCFLN